MRIVYFVISMCFVLVFNSFAQNRVVEKKVSLYPSSNQLERSIEILNNKGGYPSYTTGAWCMGYIFTTLNDSVSTKKWYRTIHEFNLSEFKNKQNMTIKNVTIYYTTNAKAFSFKLTKVASVSTDRETNWNAVANGSSLHTGVPYNGSPFPSAIMKNVILEYLQYGTMWIGAMSEQENVSDSDTQMSLYLEVTYTYETPILYLTARNDLYGNPGGQVGVGIAPNNASPHSSPHTFEAIKGDIVNLQAYDNQSVNGGLWVFNDNEGITDFSSWKVRNVNGITSLLGNTASVSTPQLNGSEGANQYIAYLEDNSRTTSGALTRDEKWFSDVSLSGDVTVPSGKILRLRPGIKVYLNGHHLYSNGGTIKQEGATINGLLVTVNEGTNIQGYYSTLPAALAGIPSNGTANYSLQLQATTYNGNLSLTSKNNVTIAGAGPASTVINGSINLSSANNCMVKDLRVPEYKYVSINGGDNNCISNVQTDNSADVLNIYDASNVNIQHLIAENGMDIGSNIRSSDGDIWCSSSYSGHLTALYFSSNSSFNVSGNNFCSNNIDINSQSSYVYILNNQLSKPYPQSLYGSYTFSGNVYVCPSGSAPAKTSSPESKTQLTASGVSNPVNTELDEADKAYMDLFSKINKENSRSNKILKTDVYTVIDKFRKVLSSKKDKYSVNRSLLRLSHCFRTTESRKEFNDMIETMLKDKSYEGIQGNIKRYLIDGYIQNREYARAAKLAEEIINSSEDEDLTCDMLYEKAMICRDYLEDSETAIKAFSQIKENYPNNPVARMAGVQLKVMGVEEKKQEGKVKKESSKSEGFGSSNYPNPFNPATTISFSIPKDGMTELKIYNMLGENIETLVSQPLSAGTYSYSWNAARYSSGIYFYVLRSGNNVQTKRMMLVK